MNISSVQLYLLAEVLNFKNRIVHQKNISLYEIYQEICVKIFMEW